MSRTCAPSLLLSFVILSAARIWAADTADEFARVRSGQFDHGWGTYSGGPHQPDGRIDRAKLLAELAQQHARAYSWLIWRNPHDWEDLQAFLPEAAKQKIRVWVTLVPPSESPPHNRTFSEPFRLDYEKWAQEIAALSVREPALVGWSIDDFVWNTRDLKPVRMHGIIDGARAVNPRLAFFPCCYFAAVSATFVRDYRDCIDGIFFPYRSESTKANLGDASHVTEEVSALRERLGPDKAVVLMVYASAHSRLGATTNAYVGEVLRAGHANADGVIVFVHQDPVRDAEKFATITQLFSAWSRAPR